MGTIRSGTIAVSGCVTATACLGRAHSVKASNAAVAIRLMDDLDTGR